MTAPPSALLGTAGIERESGLGSSRMNTTTRATQDRAPKRPGLNPPTTNRGVSPTSAAGPPPLIDWCEYSAPPGTELDAVLPGSDALEWTELERGYYGYRRGRQAGQIRVYFDGAPHMGPHVVMSGQACRELEASPIFDPDGGLDWPGLLRYVRAQDWHISRLDVALDDRDGQLDMDTIAATVKAKDVTGPWQATESTNKQYKGKDQVEPSIYFGSRKSDRFVRIYDKRAERLAAGADPGPDPWIRVEMVLRDDHAAAVADLLLEQDGELEPFREMLHQYIDFKSPVAGDSNRWRWPTVSWWAAFLGNVGKRRLGVAPLVMTLEGLSRWVERQVAPGLAVLARHKAFGVVRLFGLMRDAEDRWKPRHRALLTS